MSKAFALPVTKTLRLFEDIGGGLFFLRKLMHTAWFQRCSSRLVAEQIWSVTIQSLLTTGMAGFFVGAIMTVQFTMQVNEFGALGYLGGLSTSATIREIGPLLIAFMLSGKVGAFTSAELGTMRVTEQIDAVLCLGADPLREIILPRFFGIVISSFVLLSAGLMMSVGGGLLMAMFFSGISPEEYVRHIPTIVTLSSVAVGLFKCSVFAFVLAVICTYKGYTTRGGAKGVGRSVVQTSVSTMVSIVLADWVTSILAKTFTAMWLGH